MLLLPFCNISSEAFPVSSSCSRFSLVNFRLRRRLTQNCRLRRRRPIRSPKAKVLHNRLALPGVFGIELCDGVSERERKLCDMIPLNVDQETELKVLARFLQTFAVCGHDSSLRWQLTPVEMEIKILILPH